MCLRRVPTVYWQVIVAHISVVLQQGGDVALVWLIDRDHLCCVLFAVLVFPLQDWASVFRHFCGWLCLALRRVHSHPCHTSQSLWMTTMEMSTASGWTSQRCSITGVQHHRGGLLSCALSSPNAPPPPQSPPPLKPATPSPATHSQGSWGPFAMGAGGCPECVGGPSGGGGGAEILLFHHAALVSMCRRTTIIFFISFCAGPCFHGTQDDNKFFLGGGGSVWAGGAKIVLSSRSPCFNVSQDDNNFFYFILCRPLFSCDAGWQ